MVSAKGLVTKKSQENQVQAQQKAANMSVSTVMNNLLDSSGIRKRIDEVLGQGAPQLCSSLITIANSTKEMQQAAIDNPMSILQAGLKAATYDLPLGGDLGFAYPVAFYNSSKGGYECQFILGYKGYYQLAMRTGVYQRINVMDIREGELVEWNPLTEDMKFDFSLFQENPEERTKQPVKGYCGYFRTINGMEKYVYWTVAQIDAHEAENRKGKYRSAVWKNHYDSMAKKTVLRELLGKWGMLSISYHNMPKSAVEFTEAMMNHEVDDDDIIMIKAEANEAQQLPESTQEAAGAVEMPADAMFTADEIEAAVQGK